jgi:hypothetical protein
MKRENRKIRPPCGNGKRGRGMKEEKNKEL